MEKIWKKNILIGFFIIFMLVNSTIITATNMTFQNNVNKIDFNLNKTIYVNGSVNCSGNGTYEDPYCKIRYAIENASDGDKIIVFEGVYKENLIIYKELELSSDKKHESTIDGNNDSPIQILESSVDIIGFNIINSGSSNAGIHIGNFGVKKISDILVKDCIITNNHNGIEIEGFHSDINIESCCISNNDGIGILAIEGTDLTIKNCVLASNYMGADIRDVSDGIRIVGSFIENNILYGVVLEGIFINPEINENKITNNGKIGIFFYGVIFGSPLSKIGLSKNDIINNGNDVEKNEFNARGNGIVLIYVGENYWEGSDDFEGMTLIIPTLRLLFNYIQIRIPDKNPATKPYDYERPDVC